MNTYYIVWNNKDGADKLWDRRYVRANDLKEAKAQIRESVGYKPIFRICEKVI